MDTPTIVAFAAVALLAYVVPGPDWFVILPSAARSRRDGFLSAAGALTGLTGHLVAAGLGVSALLLASAEAFTVVKILGAAYLLYLGVRALLSARRTWRESESAPAEQSESKGGAAGTVFLKAFVANILNAKAALFFVAVLPQFITPGEAFLPQIFVLGAVDILLGCAWWAVFVLTVSRFRALLRRRRARIAIDGASGVALIGLGGALAVGGRAS